MNGIDSRVAVVRNIERTSTMGVYVFRYGTAPYIKMGHYKGTNPWSRVCHRGFYSCRNPRQVGRPRDARHLHLLAWFPNLDARAERRAHASLAPVRVVGEWYADGALHAALACLRALGGVQVAVDASDKEAAACTSRRL